MLAPDSGRTAGTSESVAPLPPARRLGPGDAGDAGDRGAGPVGRVADPAGAVGPDPGSMLGSGVGSAADRAAPRGETGAASRVSTGAPEAREEKPPVEEPADPVPVAVPAEGAGDPVAGAPVAGDPVAGDPVAGDPPRTRSRPSVRSRGVL